MSQILTYPSFLKTQDGGFLQTNDVLIDPRLRGRLTEVDRRRFDRIADKMNPARRRKLAARRSAGGAAAGQPSGRAPALAPSVRSASRS